MRKNILSTFIFIMIIMMLSPAYSKEICKLSYELSADQKELDLKIVLPDKDRDFKIESSQEDVKVFLNNFEGIIVSEKDKVEGFVEKVSFAEPSAGEKSTRQILLKLSGSYMSGVDKEGSSLRLHFSKFVHTGERIGVSSEQNYIIGPDDKISISVYNNPDLSKTIQVGKDGKANFALIGDVDVAGLSVSQLAERITQMYAKDYIVDPQLTVEIVEFNSQGAYVTGEVLVKKRVALRGNTTLKDAIAEAGGFTGFAGPEILVSRKKGSGTESEQIRIDRTDFDEGVANLTLVNGDVITVPKMKYAYIQGEVKRNCDIPIERGMTLLKAISLAQGLTDWADNIVEILREAQNDQAIETYDLKKIMDGRSPDVVLKPGDIIIVKRRFL